MNKLEILNEYCNKGWKIFPLHYIEHGQCSCGNPKCDEEAKKPGKHPATENGKDDATNDFNTIMGWYSRNEKYNWGLATGEIIVIDIDPRHGGSLEDIDFPNTLRVKTGGGGYHLYYKNSAGKDIRNSVSKISKGIDVRGYGGYAVLPPSNHLSGNTYQWENDLPLADFPYEILERVNSKKEHKPFVVPETIEDGTRNDTLFRLGSSLRAKGLSEEAIFEALRVENKHRCKPPLEEEELESIVKNGSKYEQGKIPVAPTSDSLEYSLTDLGNAERLVNHYGKVIRFCPSFGWLIWDGKKWKPDKTEIYKLAHETAKSIYLEASQTKDTLHSQKIGDWAKNSLSSSKIVSMVKMAQPYVTISSEDLDNHPYYLNVNNGVIDLRTGELLDHSPEFYLTKGIGVNFNPEATCPKWLEFLDLIFPEEEELHRFIQKAVGYSLTGSTDEQCLFFLFGEGENGKSSFVETLGKLLGEYTQKTDIETLLGSRRGGVTPHLDKFFKTRFVFTSETEEGEKFNERLIKDLTGGDTIVVNPKYKEVYTFNPTHKLWIFGNHKLEVKDMSYAFWRRMRLIPFEIKIPKDKQRKMSEVLADFESEFEGVLNWAIKGCILWQKEGLTPPEKVRMATDEYKVEQDLFSQFLEEECELSPDYRIKKDDLLAAYNEYLWRNGEKNKVSKKYLANRLAEKGIKIGGDGKRFYIGVRKYLPNNLAEQAANQQVEALFGGKLVPEG
jgi:putative DNA primase/helicase